LKSIRYLYKYENTHIFRQKIGVGFFLFLVKPSGKEDEVLSYRNNKNTTGFFRREWVFPFIVYQFA
jgi:hypothetical protein